MFSIKVKQTVDKIYEVEIESEKFQTESELHSYIECHPEFLMEISSNLQYLKSEEIKEYSFTIKHNEIQGLHIQGTSNRI